LETINPSRYEEMVLIVAEMIEQLTTYKSYVWQIDTDTVVILEHGALRVT